MSVPLQKPEGKLFSVVNKPSETLSTEGDGEPPDMTALIERLARLEEAISGLRHSQNLTIGAVAAVGAIIAAMMLYGYNRIDTLSDRINDKNAALNEKISALPGQVSSELRDTVKALSDAITATKQQQPQVIWMQQPPSPTLQDLIRQQNEELLKLQRSIKPIEERLQDKGR